jgi:hypothetical protein
MPETLLGVDPDRLERSCNRRRDAIRFGTGAPGLERAEVYLSALAFEPRRHDTYAIGITTAVDRSAKVVGMALSVAVTSARTRYAASIPIVLNDCAAAVHRFPR